VNKMVKMIFVFCMLISTDCYAECTSFCFVTKDAILFGHNLDWHVGDGIICVNKRNVTKKVCWFNSNLKWISRYGSITINQWGREFPSRGMNEVGLVVAEMTLKETQFPFPDSRTPISSLQWIQYQLDNCATIEEVIETNSKIRIDPKQYPSHFLVSDSSGNCVTMEWINGKLVYHTREKLPIKVLSNSSYASCIKYYNPNYSPTPYDYSSTARFYRAAEMIRNYDPISHGPEINYAFDILEKVGRIGRTKWNLVFDIKKRYFYFRTDVNRTIGYVDFDSINFSCNTPVTIFEIAKQFSGNIQNHFIEYNYDINRTLITDVSKKLERYIGQIPEKDIKAMVNYPETTICNPINSVRDKKQ